MTNDEPHETAFAGDAEVIRCDRCGDALSIANAALVLAAPVDEAKSLELVNRLLFHHNQDRIMVRTLARYPTEWLNRGEG